MPDNDHQIDPEVQALVDQIDSELAGLSPAECRARLLVKLQLPADASDEEIDRAVQAFVMSYVTRMSPEQKAIWESEMKESPLFLHALTARCEDGEEPTDEELDEALAQLAAIEDFDPSPRMIVEMLVTRLEENGGALVVHAVIPAIADSHKDSAPFTIPAAALEEQDVAALKQRANQDGTVDPPAIFLGEAKSTDRGLFAGWTQKDFDSLDLHGLMMMPRMVKL